MNFFKSIIDFLNYFLVPQMAGRSQTSTDLSVYVYGGLHKVLTLPAHVLLGKDKSEMFL